MMDFTQIFDENKSSIFYFSKPGCPFCEKLDAELVSLGLPYSKYVLDPTDASYEDEAKQLKALAQMNTFPMLFFGEKKIGGYSDFMSIVVCTETLNNELAPLGLKIEHDF